MKTIKFDWRLGIAGWLMAGACASVSGQSPESPQALSDSEQQIVQKLGDLSILPEAKWRTHPGDMPHGEDPNLDDRSWPEAKQDEFVSGAVWFRQWVEVPGSLHGYNLTGARIWFEFQANANMPITEVIYVNGNRVALGDNLEPIVLFNGAESGAKVLVAVKLLSGAAKVQFVGSKLNIDAAPGRPAPNDIRTELLSAAELIPGLSTNIPADEATLHKAFSAIDFDALAAGDQSRFDSSLAAAQKTLETLKPLMQQATFHATGNSHIDAAWLWTRSESVDVVKNTFGTALQLMNEYPNYTFTQSSAQYNAWIAEKYPEMNNQIKQRVKEGRWEIVGGMWVEPDLNLPDGESIARSILIAKRWYLKNYGVDVRVGWNPDSFGYSWQLPQIYKKCGIDYFVTQKMEKNDTNKLPLKLFWWQSPDGSKVLTYFPHGLGNRSLDPVELSADLREARQYAPGMTRMMDLYGVGDHGGGPTRAILDQGEHWATSDAAVPKMQFGTASAYFKAVEGEIAPHSPTWNYELIAKGYHPPDPLPGKIAIPTWSDEIYLEFHRGTYTTQAHFKRNLREAPEWSLAAEKLASLAWLYGAPYPVNRLTDAWEKITFNDFHDLAAGSGIGAIYKDGQRDFDVVRWETNEISSGALNVLSSRVNTSGPGVPILVFNPLGWKRSGSVTVSVQMPQAAGEVSVLDAGNQVVPSEQTGYDAQTHTFKLLVDVQDVPSLGYEVLHVVPGRRPFATDLKVSGLTLENAALRVTVDKTSGCITSLFDKRTRFESLAPGTCGNELQLYHDLPKKYDAWNIDPGTYDIPPLRLDSADSVQLIENDSLRAIVRVTRHTQNSKFSQDIMLAEGSDEVVVSTKVDWHETHELLKAAFVLAATSDTATYEIPYGTIERPTTRNNSWEKARFEVPAQRWADLGDGGHGFSLINDSKFGYDAAGNVLRLTLLRSPVWPDPDADRGQQQFSYALYPHRGGWKQSGTVRHGYEFNNKLEATEVAPHGGDLPPKHSFVSVEPETVTLTAVKKAEDSNALILHLYEWAGKSGDMKIAVPPGATGARETNLLEQPQGPELQVNAGTVTVPVRPYEIVAVSVDYPQNEVSPEK